MIRNPIQPLRYRLSPDMGDSGTSGGPARPSLSVVSLTNPIVSVHGSRETESPKLSAASVRSAGRETFLHFPKLVHGREVFDANPDPILSLIISL